MEAAEHEVNMGEDMVLEFTTANDFVGISGIAEGLQKQREKATGYRAKGDREGFQMRGIRL